MRVDGYDLPRASAPRTTAPGSSPRTPLMSVRNRNIAICPTGSPDHRGGLEGRRHGRPGLAIVHGVLLAVLDSAAQALDDHTHTPRSATPIHSVGRLRTGALLRRGIAGSRGNARRLFGARRVALGLDVADVLAVRAFCTVATADLRAFVVAGFRSEGATSSGMTALICVVSVAGDTGGLGRRSLLVRHFATFSVNATKVLVFMGNVREIIGLMAPPFLWWTAFGRSADGHFGHCQRRIPWITSHSFRAREAPVTSPPTIESVPYAREPPIDACVCFVTFASTGLTGMGGLQ